jgi:hypothetical protein
MERQFREVWERLVAEGRLNEELDGPRYWRIFLHWISCNRLANVERWILQRLKKEVHRDS